MNDPLDDRNLDGMTDVNHHGVLVGRYNYALDDLTMDVNLDASRDRRMSDRLDDRNLDVNLLNRSCVLRDQNLVVNLVVSRGLRMNDLLDDLNLDDARHGLRMGDDLMTDVSHDLRMNVRLDDLNLDESSDVSHDLRMNDLLDDLNLDAMTDVNLYRHTNGRLDDRNLDVTKDGKKSHRVDLSIDPECYVLVGRCNYALDDRKTDASHVNHNYARRDRKMNASLVAMNLHEKLMAYLSTNCDRMSHDRLQCGHQKMRRHDTNLNLVVKNLDVNHRMKVCQKTDDWMKNLKGHCVYLMIYPMHLHREIRLMTVCLKKI
jgi:hypothetical protein